MKGKLTKYQTELMQHLWAGSPAGVGAIDFDELLGQLRWKPTKAAAHFSLRAPICRELICKQEARAPRRGGPHLCSELTDPGRQTLDPGLTPAPSPKKLFTPGVVWGVNILQIQRDSN
jgi:hypothetical protein